MPEFLQQAFLRVNCPASIRGLVLARARDDVKRRAPRPQTSRLRRFSAGATGFSVGVTPAPPASAPVPPSPRSAASTRGLAPSRGLAAPSAGAFAGVRSRPDMPLALV